VTKKRKIILISVAVTLALVMTVGGVVAAINGGHEELGGHKLIGVGEMGYEEFDLGIWGPTGAYYYMGEIRGWDTQFIITNPNCDPDWYLDIEWVALIAGEDTYDWDAEDVIFEGTPDDWFSIGIEIPYDLSPHEVWQVSLADLIFRIENGYPPDDEELYYFIADLDLNKYTLEVTWSRVYYSSWSGWRRGRPLAGWQKEKCRHMMYGDSMFGPPVEFPGLAISEAEMKLYPRRMSFSPPFID
jgi:hypothetical protein